MDMSMCYIFYFMYDFRVYFRSWPKHAFPFWWPHTLCSTMFGLVGAALYRLVRLLNTFVIV